MTNQVTLNLKLSNEEVVFHYDQLLDGNIFFTTTPHLIKQNFENFTIENPFPDRNTRYSVREENAFIACLQDDGEVFQILLTKDSDENYFKNHKDEGVKNLYKDILVYAFEITKLKTFGNICEYFDELNKEEK
jgi:hypothetical protein